LPFDGAASILMAMSSPVTEPRIEPATIEDLPQLVELTMALFDEEEDFNPDKTKQEQGIRMILEQPKLGRIFVLRTDHQVIGMVNLLFTISTAEGGPVVLMEDVIVHPQHRRQGYGGRLLEYAVDFARQKSFKRITLLTDRISATSQTFFASHGFGFSSMIPMRLVFADKA
jgi:N-acetylglutamate synthase-like GNAT family acetyltransferase